MFVPCCTDQQDPGTWNDDIGLNLIPMNVADKAKLFHKVAPEYGLLLSLGFGACDNYFKTGQIEIDGRLISLAHLFSECR